MAHGADKAPNPIDGHLHRQRVFATDALVEVLEVLISIQVKNVVIDGVVVRQISALAPLFILDV